MRTNYFPVFNLILPCILITGIALMSFYMPSDSGEKVVIFMMMMRRMRMMMTSRTMMMLNVDGAL